MSNEQIQQLTAQYFLLREQGKSFGDIRQALKKEGIEEVNISAIIRQIDEQEREQVLLKEEIAASVRQMWIGAFISAVGIGIVIYTYCTGLAAINGKVYGLLFVLVIYGFYRFRRAFHRYNQYELIDE